MKINELQAIVEQQSATIIDLMERVAKLEARPQRGQRNYGPKSETSMTNEIAWRIMFGDRTKAKVKDIADEFGLSRGQVYSVRGGYTFTHVKNDAFHIDADGNVIAND